MSKDVVIVKDRGISIEQAATPAGSGPGRRAWDANAPSKRPVVNRRTDERGQTGQRSICADVRPIIRAVFREVDYLPPLGTELPAPVCDRRAGGSFGDQWTEKYKSESKDIWLREEELKRQHASRISQEPLPNIYHLSPPPLDSPPLDARGWQLDRGLIVRRDLVPGLEQDAGRDGSLWIKNILNRSSCDVSAVELVGRSLLAHPAHVVTCDDNFTLHSFSIGDVQMLNSLPRLPSACPPPAPDYMLCVPPRLDFINFTVGQQHTQGLRLVNVSKYEIRVSVRPPKRRELDVEISGQRGLTVTSGAAAEFRVHFRPQDVRTVKDMLLIRVSLGRDFLVPITCYMEPPVLDIMIPSLLSQALTCKPREAGFCNVRHSCDVLELGARLLGDVHSTRVLLHCDADHVTFFMLTEDNWLSLNLDCLTVRGSVSAGSFALWPAWWGGGGGSVRGCVWCHARHVGLHAAVLRVLSSTAIARQLYLLADSVLFRPEHVTVAAQEKDYDICSDGEPACEYYVHLGTAFPNRSLSATVQLINHSPVTYSYYWSVRAFNVCSCWEDESSSGSSDITCDADSEQRCGGANEARDFAHRNPVLYESQFENARLLRVEPGRSQVSPRSACTMHVHVPDVGPRLGVQRAVLMLILKDIPRESFPPEYEPMIVRSEDVATDAIPGFEGSVRELCEIVSAQMEVWWDVVPVRFVLDPPALSLHHSRRMDFVEVDIKATQLFGCEGAQVTWHTPAQVSPPAPLRLAPADTCATTLCYPLPSLPNHYPETDVITLVAAEWQTQCSMTRQCATRHPALQPERAWLGVVAPGTHMHTTFQVINDTYQHICWWAEPFRWWGENQPSPACVGRVPCDTCHERACSCGLLRPTRGALHHNARADICYDVNAPESDGCVATLVRVRRTGADVAAVPGAPATEARAALLAYRVLAPRLVLRLLNCLCDPNLCSGCLTDAGELVTQRGTAILRPRQALTLGRITCYRLRLTNVTPLPAVVKFDKEHDAADVLKVKFNPNEFKVQPYAEVEVVVVVEARRVCGRRLFVYRGLVESAYKPIYMLLDTAIEGVKISCEVPLGDSPKPESFVILTRTQREVFPWEEGRPKLTTGEDVFAEEDRKKEAVQENRCNCPFDIVYIPPPPPRPRPPKMTEEQTPIEILSQPPSLTRVCACDRCSKPLLPQLEQPICLQFTAVPLRTVVSRTLVLRNSSVVTAHWRAELRRFPRTHRRTLGTDPWASDVAAPGVALSCSPAAGVLAARAHVALSLRVYADCWGLYHDQLLIQVDDVEPIVLDVWVEARGAPLEFAITPAPAGTPVMWTSASDKERVVRATNVSRAPLTVHAYTAAAYEYPQDMLPFRLYLRYYDTPPRSCPCLYIFDDMELAGEESALCSVAEEVDTGFEIYLAPDHGPQNDSVYNVSPDVATVGAGEVAEWRVALMQPEHAGVLTPDIDLLLRLLPVEGQGAHWARGEPPAQAVRLRLAPRVPCLQLSVCELRVRLCALHLPQQDILRVRKNFHVINVGSGLMELGMETEVPWSVVQEGAGDGATEDGGACGCDQRQAARLHTVPLRLEPQSSTEMCVEVCVSTERVWPRGAESEGRGAEGEGLAAYCQPPLYPARTVTSTPLHIYDDDNILATLPLRLELEFPVLRATPAQLDLRVVADGDTRKCYFSMSHSSRTETLDLATQWIGGEEFNIWPPFLRVAPGESANVYLQYTAVWQAAPVEGCVCVHVCGGGAGAWCRTVVPVRVAPARDHKFHMPRHDHTDDPHLLPVLD